MLKGRTWTPTSRPADVVLPWMDPGIPLMRSFQVMLIESFKHPTISTSAEEQKDHTMVKQELDFGLHGTHINVHLRVEVVVHL